MAMNENPMCSIDELRAFLLECRALRLEVIPLVQTFGHVEVGASSSNCVNVIDAQFVLKHSAFAGCREHRWYANSLCPSNEASFALVAQMLDQILAFHEGIASIIHIGCDEVRPTTSSISH